MIRKTFLTLGVVVCMLGLTIFSQTRIDAMRRAAVGDELLYIPSKAILKHLTAGMSNVVADLLWIETIKYTVSEFHNPERKFQWLDHMLGATTELDPYFEGVYVNGGMFLAAIGRDDRALDYLKEGFVRNPESWKLPHEIVKVYTLNRRDQPAAIVAAPYYLRMVAERHQYPQLYLNWARQIQEKNDLAGQSREIWEDVIRKAKDPFVREVAQKNLNVLVAGDAERSLQKLCDRYFESYGHSAGGVDEFVRLGWIPAAPDVETYGEFFIDGDGQVRSMRVLEDKLERMLLSVNSRLRIESEKHGRSPRDLKEFEEWAGDTMLPYPIPGKDWTYDPATGKLS